MHLTAEHAHLYDSITPENCDGVDADYEGYGDDDDDVDDVNVDDVVDGDVVVDDDDYDDADEVYAVYAGDDCVDL